MKNDNGCNDNETFSSSNIAIEGIKLNLYHIMSIDLSYPSFIKKEKKKRKLLM